MRIFGCFIIAIVFAVACSTAHSSILYKIPFRSFTTTFIPPFILVERDGRKAVCGIFKGNLVCIHENRKAEKVCEINGDVEGATFLVDKRCFAGILRKDSSSPNPTRYYFEACLDGTYMEKLLTSNSLVAIIKDSSQKVYVCSCDYSECANPEIMQMKNPEELQQPIYYSSGSCLPPIPYIRIFEYNLINNQLIGVDYSQYQYNTTPMICYSTLYDRTHCKDVNIGEVNTSTSYFSSFNLFSDGENLYVSKRVDNGIAVGVMAFSAIESEISEEAYTILNTSSPYPPYIFGLNGTPYILLDNWHDTVYTIKDGKLLPITSFFVPSSSSSSYTYLNGKIFAAVGNVLVSWNTETGVIEAFPLPFSNGTVESIFAAGERIIVKFDRNDYESCEFAVLSPDGELLGTLTPIEGEKFSTLSTVLDSKYIAVVVEHPDSTYSARIFDLSLNPMWELSIGYAPSRPSFICGNYLGTISSDGLLIYNLLSGEFTTAFSTWGIGIDTALCENGTVFIGASGISEEGQYAYFTYLALERYIESGTKNPWFLIGKFDYSVQVKILKENDIIYMFIEPFFLSIGPLKISSLNLNFSENRFAMNEVFDILPPSFSSTPRFTANVNGKLSFVYFNGTDYTFNYTNLKDYAKPVALSEKKEVKLGWLDNFSGYPYPLEFPLTVGGDFYLDPEKNSIIMRGNTLDVYIATPNYDVPYDLYIAVLQDDNTVKFVSPNGFVNEPVPLFSNLSGGIYVKAEDVPVELLPKGTYYIMVRRAGTPPLDFESPGYQVVEAFRIE